MKKGTISLCMIARNEESLLPGCLESVKGVVDEIVVLDTGSGDRTRKVAREHGAKVHPFEWFDDFSAARNESLRHATCDWVLCMDADERLAPESVSELVDLARPEDRAVVYSVHILNDLKDGAEAHISAAQRLFTHHRGIFFSGIIHEQISPSAATIGADQRESGIILNHLGYALDTESTKAKHLRNRALLEKMVKRSPHSAYAHYTLAQIYLLTHQPEMALAHFQAAYDLKEQFGVPLLASLLNKMAEAHLALSNVTEAKDLLRRSVEMAPNQVLGHFRLYEIAYSQGPEDALERLQIVFEKNREVRASGKQISTDIVLDQDRILQVMATLSQKAGLLDKAISYYESLCRKREDDAGIVETLAHLYVRLGEFEKAESRFRKLLRMEGRSARTTDLLGLVLIRQKKFSEAIGLYESLLGKCTLNAHLIDRLAGLYAKVGDIPKAREILTLKHTLYSDSFAQGKPVTESVPSPT